MAKIGINLSTGSLQKKDIIIGISPGILHSLIAVVHPGTGQPVVLKEHDGSWSLPSDHLIFASVENMCMRLKELRKRAAHILKTPVRKAVVSVPTSFNAGQRKGMVDAGKLAGVEIVQIINETAAAALAYGAGLLPGSRKTIVSCNCHENVFDISIINIDNGLYEVLATYINTKPGDVTFRDAPLSSFFVDDIIVSGASANAVSSVQCLKEYFGRDVHQTINAEEATALGVAIQADVLAGNNKNFSLIDTSPYSLAIEAGGKADVLFPQNTLIPATASRVFRTATTSQEILHRAVYQSANLLPDSEPVGELTIRSIPAMPAGFAAIDVLFHLNSDGLLILGATELLTGFELAVTWKPRYGYGDDDMKKMLLGAVYPEPEDVGKSTLAEAEHEAEQLIDKTRKFIATHTTQLTDAEVEAAKKGIDDIMAVIVFSNQGITDKNVRALEAINLSIRNRIVQDVISRKQHEL